MNVTACLRGKRRLIHLIVPKRCERERAKPLEHAPLFKRVAPTDALGHRAQGSRAVRCHGEVTVGARPLDFI